MSPIISLLWQQWHRTATGYDGQQVVPAADHAASMTLDQLAQRHGHLLLNCARVVHVSADVKQLYAHIQKQSFMNASSTKSSSCRVYLDARVSLATERGEPRSAASTNGRRHGHRLHISDRGGTAEEADVGRKGRL